MTYDNRCSVSSPDGSPCALVAGHRPPHRGGGRMWLGKQPLCPVRRTPQGARCIFDAGHEHPHRDERDTEWQVSRCPVVGPVGGRCSLPDHHGVPHRDVYGRTWTDQEAGDDRFSLGNRFALLGDAVEELTEKLRASWCGATHTPDDVTYVCSRRSGHAGGHLDDAQDEWWALPVRNRERAETSADRCGERLKDYGFLCREPGNHDGPHVDRFFGMSWGMVRLEKLPALCGFPCFFSEGHEGECSHRY